MTMTMMMQCWLTTYDSHAVLPVNRRFCE